MSSAASKLVTFYRHLSTGFVLGTFPTRIFIAEYGGTQLTLAGVSLTELAASLRLNGGGCIVGNF